MGISGLTREVDGDAMVMAMVMVMVMVIVLVMVMVMLMVMVVIMEAKTLQTTMHTPCLVLAVLLAPSTIQHASRNAHDRGDSLGSQNRIARTSHDLAETPCCTAGILSVP